MEKEANGPGDGNEGLVELGLDYVSYDAFNVWADVGVVVLPELS